MSESTTIPKGIINAVKSNTAMLCDPALSASPLAAPLRCVDCVAHSQTHGPKMIAASRVVANATGNTVDQTFSDYLVAFHAGGHQT